MKRMNYPIVYLSIFIICMLVSIGNFYVRNYLIGAIVALCGAFNLISYRRAAAAQKKK